MAGMDLGGIPRLDLSGGFRTGGVMRDLRERLREEHGGQYK